MARKQKALLQLNFEDGSSKRIVLDAAVEIDVSDERKQSICFNQTAKGWVMTFTKPLFEGKKIDTIWMKKETGEAPSGAHPDTFNCFT